MKRSLNRQLTHETLRELLQVVEIESVSLEHLRELFYKENEIKNYFPDGICQLDPRNGDRIVYNSARAHRPHDNLPVDPEPPSELSDRECLICAGKTTGVVDVADLSQGFTFINWNLFPILYPGDTSSQQQLLDNGRRFLSPQGIAVHGYHFLQWTSSLHDKDWDNMPPSDRIVVMQRLAALEQKLLSGSESGMEIGTNQTSKESSRGYVSIIKNFGRLVGGSLVHGHQQIGFSNLMPRRVIDHQRFEMDHGENFSAYLLRQNPSDLILHDYGSAVLLVPYFMRRPFDMFLQVNDTSKRYLYELNEVEIAAVADGWHDAIRAILLLMPQLGKEKAYNVITNSGPGAGLYFEFLPYTQEIGGFEHLGLYMCQGNPQDTAEQLRLILEKTSA
jgi:galactose-1-phosphate uridylyltransferase